MTNLKLGELNIGNVDGRYEFELDRPDHISSTFYIPEFINFDMFKTRSRYFVHGLRGVGKTSILRWLHAKASMEASFSKFVLFKSDLTEAQRVEISRASGFRIVETDKNAMEFSQDFKESWYWFFFYQIGLIIKEDYNGLRGATPFLKLLGLADDSLVERVGGWMPKVTKSKITLKGKFGPFEGGYEGEIERSEGKVEMTMPSMISLLKLRVKEIEFPNTVYIFVDELEIFKDNREQYDRDRRFVRDIIFVVSELNEFFRESGVDVILVLAVRTEVLLAIGSLGQEIQRRVYDKGVFVHWDQFNCTLKHPILDMVRKKLQHSERLAFGDQLTLDGQDDVFLKYFPNTIHQYSVEDFLLNRSFYRPRDVVQRLQIAAESHSEESFFSEEILDGTDQTYSRRVWEEVAYGLSAKYTDEEIRVIENLFAGAQAYFYMSDIEHRLKSNARRSNSAKAFAEKHRAADVLMDLYMFGAVGNDYFAGEGAFRNRWIYRGDQDLFLNKRMILQRALWRRFDAIDSLQSTEVKAIRGNESDEAAQRSPKRTRRGSKRKRGSRSGKGRSSPNAQS